MAFAVLTANTSLTATMADIRDDPAGTHSFSFAPGAEEEFYILDDDGTFNDGTGDGNQVVAPSSTIFLDNTLVASRHKFDVTPDNGDPSFTVYLVFENSTPNNDSTSMNLLDYALVSDTPLIAGVNYSISNYSSDGTVAYSNFSNLILCFAEGTMIDTDSGPRAVEDLCEGDLVRTLDHGFEPILWVRHTEHEWSRDPCKTKPIQFNPGSLGPNRPERELVVSPQHRMLVRCSNEQMLAPAIGLTDHPGVRQKRGCRRITYYHLMFQNHEIIFAEGVPTESFLLGPWVSRHLTKRQRAQLFGSDPDQDQTLSEKLARPSMTVRKSREMVRSMRDRLAVSIC